MGSCAVFGRSKGKAMRYLQTATVVETRVDALYCDSTV